MGDIDLIQDDANPVPLEQRCDRRDMIKVFKMLKGPTRINPNGCLMFTFEVDDVSADVQYILNNQAVN